MSLNCSLRLPSGPTFSVGYSPKPKATFSYGGSRPAYSVGGNTFNSSGYLASNARNVKRDGIDDLLSGSLNASPNRSVVGQSYVMFGSRTGLTSNVKGLI
jgi:hypothetical protein